MKSWVISRFTAFGSWWRTHSNNAAAISELHSFTSELIKEKQAITSDAEEHVARAAAEDYRKDTIIKELRQEVDRLSGENEVLKAQIELYTYWEARERARLEAEADMWRRRGDGSPPPTDDLV